MTTFNLEVCQRIQKILGEKTPKTYFVRARNPFGAWGQWARHEAPEDWEITAMFTIADLDRTVWEELGKKLGWGHLIDGVGTIGPVKLDVSHLRAERCFSKWLTGGYEAANEYLLTILPE